MANSFSPNGFMPVRRLDQAAWTLALTQRKIAAANTNGFFRGDPVIVLNTGYIDAVAPSSLPTQGTLGIFWGFEYQGNTTAQSPWSRYRPAAATTYDGLAQIITDPMTVFQAWVGTGASSAAGGPATLAALNVNINYRLGTGNTSNGQSGAYVDYATLALTATLPFTIVGLVQDPPGVNGRDIASAGNLVEVVQNQSAYKFGTTGIS